LIKAIQLLLEIIGWVTIVFGTTAGAALIAFPVYLKWTGEIGKTVSVVMVVSGFILGSIWATKIWKRQGTIDWLSGTRSIR
jgi:hypothetical protein